MTYVKTRACVAALALLPMVRLAAQDMPGMDHSKMNMPGMNHAMADNDTGNYLMQMASGTSQNPQSFQMPMRMAHLKSWHAMFMGQAYLVDTQQSGPRGGDKLYSPNWFMAAAEHKLGTGAVMFQAMLSLDAATVTGRQYPLLFQTGETGFGKPLVDAQHPHDFLMSFGVHYARPLTENTTLQLYYAPVGDPALGPVAFPHRASASELPQATLGHHWQDSSHIANNVLTAAVKRKWLRLEASGFYGSEPNENRWNIDFGPMNSWAGRLSVTPSKNWMAQVSVGRLSRAERQHDGDILRSTASVHYTRPMGERGDWSSSVIWGRNHDTDTKRDLNSWLFETVYPATKKTILTARVEHVAKDELFANDAKREALLDRTAGSTFNVQAYTFGVTRNILETGPVETGVGANVSFYGIPRAIEPYYGEHPRGVNIYLRFRLRSMQ